MFQPGCEQPAVVARSVAKTDRFPREHLRCRETAGSRSRRPGCTRWDGPRQLRQGPFTERQEISGARLVTVPDCGHTPAFEHPDVLTRHLVELITAVSLARCTVPPPDGCATT